MAGSSRQSPHARARGVHAGVGVCQCGSEGFEGGGGAAGHAGAHALLPVCAAPTPHPPTHRPLAAAATIMHTHLGRRGGAAAPTPKPAAAAAATRRRTAAAAAPEPAPAPAAAAATHLALTRTLGRRPRPIVVGGRPARRARLPLELLGRRRRPGRKARKPARQQRRRSCRRSRARTATARWPAPAKLR